MLTGIANKVIVFSHGYLKEGQISEFLALLQRYSGDDDGKDRMSVKIRPFSGQISQQARHRTHLNAISLFHYFSNGADSGYFQRGSWNYEKGG